MREFRKAQLGLGYGMGAKKLAGMCFSDGTTEVVGNKTIVWFRPSVPGMDKPDIVELGMGYRVILLAREGAD